MFAKDETKQCHCQFLFCYCVVLVICYFVQYITNFSGKHETEQKKISIDKTKQKKNDPSSKFNKDAE